MTTYPDVATEPLTPESPAFAVKELRATFEEGVTRSLDWRAEQLQGLIRMLEKEEQTFADALASDLGKSGFEAWMTEIGFSANDLHHLLKHMEQWAAPRRSKVPMTHQPGRAWIQPEPLGVVLVISPWNYPLQLTLLPIATALAAGNCVIAKPSEIAPATSAALARLLPQYVDSRAVRVIEGGVPETTALLEQRFDHILYTGNGRVGRVVMRAAAEHLTPVTLELGGKSPVIVASDADIDVAARRIVMGKFLNAGQTCIAPDYVLVESSVHDRLLQALTKSISEFYGDAEHSNDYGRIVNSNHFARVCALLDGEGAGTVVTGGQRNADTRYIAPTVLSESEPTAQIMQEEIFGPLLPVLPVESVEAAIRFVNERDKPLALYVFSENSSTIDLVLESTSAGGSCVNTTIMHIVMPDLPFGGVGESGVGAYHGQAGFDTFSHLRSVYAKPTKIDLKLNYPPYTSLKQRIIRKVM